MRLVAAAVGIERLTDWIEELRSSGARVNLNSLLRDEAAPVDDEPGEVRDLAYLLMLARRVSDAGGESAPADLTVATQSATNAAPHDRGSSPEADAWQALETAKRQILNRDLSILDAKAHIARLQEQVKNRDELIDQLRSKAGSAADLPEDDPASLPAQRPAAVRATPSLRKFAGANGLRCQTLGNGWLTRFTMDVALQLDQTELSGLSYDYGEHWPPMAFASNTFAGYLAQNGFRLKMAELDTILQLDESGALQFQLACHATDRETTFAVKLADGTTREFIGSPVDIGRQFVIGAGYKQRGWRGYISLFRIREIRGSGQDIGDITTILEFDGSRLVAGSVMKD